jgi:hypothetical protein
MWFLVKCSVYSLSEGVPVGVDAIHLVRPVGSKKLVLFLRKRGIRKVSLSANCFLRLHQRVKDFARENGVEFEVCSSRGRAIGLPIETIREVAGLYRDDVSLRKIEEKTGVPKSTAHYLIKKAGRKKIRNNKRVVYTR